jgi:branched-chain amino acid transport system permease protein
MKVPKQAAVKWTLYGLCAIILLTCPLYVGNSYILHIIITAAVWVILTTSMHLLLKTGLFTLGHAAFMGVGAYASALLTMRAGWSFWLALPMAGIISALLAATVGPIFLKVKGLLLAVITFAFGEAVLLTLTHWPGPPDGITGIPAPNPIVISPLISIEFVGKTPFYFLIVFITVIAVFILYRVEKSRLGRILECINENDELTESAGVNVHLFRLISFCIACFFAGIAGSLYAHYHTYAAPKEFSVWASTLIFLFCVIGGTRSLAGPVVGALFLTAIPELLRGARTYQSLMYAILVLGVVFLLPDGLTSLPDRLGKLLDRHKGNKTAIKDNADGPA